MKDLFNILFVLLFASVFVWLALCNWLYNRLDKQHPEKYNAMGRPGLMWNQNNSMSNAVALLTFLFQREYLDLHDPTLTRFCQFMAVFLILYVICFAILFLGVSLGYSR